MKPEHREQIVKLLEQVVTNEITAKRAIDSWPNIDEEQDALIKSAWHELYHFYTDEDIRKKDAAYDQERREVISKFVQRIKMQTDN
ncbi:hypothetical protein [Pedosphaera parvula]|uniref:Uncharacterized protein n=1 Tax=Pedosphaera parvula (strain Ellin514) TaxID=320771 RepID=B9XDH6_PEDPL|nr:hypothetical protein [Pedosphaera parvula]EEF62122.1 hypothetical protein Cflav_PD6397 [Pedosphaera parvula Ellin514]